jgi:uncharacterized protein
MTHHPLPRNLLAQHVLVLGKTRSGKSSTMRGLVEQLLDDRKPVCIIDPKGDWWGIKSSADGKHAGYEVVIFGGRHADVPIDQHSGKVVAEIVATGNRPALIDLGGWMVAERTRFFIDFASTLFTKTHGHRWLVIDECHNFAPQGKVLDPEAGKMLHWSNRLASEGAGKGIVLISASQRPQKVHKDYVTSHETLIAKRVIHPLDRGAMKEWIDGCGDPAKGKEVLDSLAGLQRPEGWVWSPEIGFGPKRVTFPMFSTYDSFAVQTGDADRKLKGWAAIDLEEVKSKLAAVVKEAKANDPRELRAEIEKLRAENNKLSAAAQVLPENADAGPDAIKDAEERGFEQAKKKLAAASQRAVREKIAGLLDKLEQEIAPAMDAVNVFRGNLAEHVRDLRRERADLDAVSFEATSQPPARRQPARATQREPRPVPTLNGNGLGRPLQTIIDAIRWWNVLGISAPNHAQVAFAAGYSHKSGTWATYLSQLRSMGLIEGRGDLVLTADGAVVAREPGVPPSGERLRAMVIDKLDGPLVRILTPVMKAFPQGLSHQEAGERAGYSATSGTWATYLSRLRSLDLIEGRGELKAQDWLFP